MGDNIIITYLTDLYRHRDRKSNRQTSW